MTPTTTETQALAHPRRVPKWVATLGAPVVGVVVGSGHRARC